jgi:hypothetical protein
MINNSIGLFRVSNPYFYLMIFHYYELKNLNFERCPLQQ